MHYWSKASLFAHPIANYVLTSSGCIPVDRKSKDRMVLFKGTFDTLRKDKVVALFPEGTSYTEPRIMQVKDGAAWAALEYAKLQREKPADNGSKEIVIVPVAIVYTNKSKYRSDVSLSLLQRVIRVRLTVVLGFGRLRKTHRCRRLPGRVSLRRRGSGKVRGETPYSRP
jgi:1-acyl-sn-glycerol-3-phosphate acyltransferase